MDRRAARRPRAARRDRRHAPTRGPTRGPIHDDLHRRVDDNLYIRSYRGAEGGWYRAARRSGRGRVNAAAGYDVVLEPAPDVDQAAVDAAYRAKYGRSSYVDAMVTDAAAATTLRLTLSLDDQEDR